MTLQNVQRLAAAWCVLMVGLLSVVQVTVRTPPPVPLFLVFVGVWIFGAAMLFVAPVFGAIGTALYGVLLGMQVIAMHGTDPLDLAIAAGSFIGTALALWFLVERLRAKTHVDPQG